MVWAKSLTDSLSHADAHRAVVESVAQLAGGWWTPARVDSLLVLISGDADGNLTAKDVSTAIDVVPLALHMLAAALRDGVLNSSQSNLVGAVESGPQTREAG